MPPTPPLTASADLVRRECSTRPLSPPKERFDYRRRIAQSVGAQRYGAIEILNTLYIEIERFVVIAVNGGNYGFSGEAAEALRLGPCTLDRPPAFFANTVEYHRRESLHHKVGFARVQGRGNRSSA